MPEVPATYIFVSVGAPAVRSKFLQTLPKRTAPHQADSPCVESVLRQISGVPEASVRRPPTVSCTTMSRSPVRRTRLRSHQNMRQVPDFLLGSLGIRSMGHRSVPWDIFK